jgi:FkbM family methyltransferase
VLRTPLLWGNEIAIEGDDVDSYLLALPDGEPFHDGVLELLGALVAAKGSASIIDVGANLGVFSLGLASLGSHVKVVAVEANPRTVGWLEKNAVRNGCTQVQVVQRAISDEPGSLSFCDNHEFAAGSMPLEGAPAEFVEFLNNRSDATHEVIEVPAVRLDDLVTELELDSLDILKIDVEGHDIRVVRGAFGTIERFKPVVIMEFATLAISLHAGMLPSDVLREVRGLFQDVYVVREGGLLHRIAGDADAIGFLEGNAVCSPVQDLVCVPAGCPLADAVAQRVTTEPGRTREDHLYDLEEELRQARAQLAQVTAELGQVAADRDDARQHAANLERTVSWRVTAPLRLAKREITEFRARRAAR